MAEQLSSDEPGDLKTRRAKYHCSTFSGPTSELEGNELISFQLYSLRKPKVFAWQILQRYLTKEGSKIFPLFIWINSVALRSKI